MRSSGIVQRGFFQRDPLTCSRELIGCELFWGECSGVIVETEAYSASGDEACHAFYRPSTRAFMARSVPGTAYVYLNYGMYWLLNVLVKGGSDDGFVLIRAVEPKRGTELMAQRRGQQSLHSLCSGPGKLTQAFGISGVDHGLDLCAGNVGFRHRFERAEVEADCRIGISKAAHLPWRFLLKGSPFVSVRPRKR
ncbi:MAG: DNA-3-methyladenine glycosylase [Verrucomicrobiota bacterium]